MTYNELEISSALHGGYCLMDSLILWTALIGLISTNFRIFKILKQCKRKGFGLVNSALAIAVNTWLCLVLT